MKQRAKLAMTGGTLAVAALGLLAAPTVAWAQDAGANIVVGREVEGTVTLTLNDIPWRVALDTIVKTLGYTVVQEDRGILRIVDPANLKEQLETRIFPLRFVRPSSPYRASIDTQ